MRHKYHLFINPETLDQYWLQTSEDLANIYHSSRCPCRSYPRLKRIMKKYVQHIKQYERKFKQH